MSCKVWCDFHFSPQIKKLSIQGNDKKCNITLFVTQIFIQCMAMQQRNKNRFFNNHNKNPIKTGLGLIQGFLIYGKKYAKIFTDLTLILVQNFRQKLHAENFD